MGRVRREDSEQTKEEAEEEERRETEVYNKQEGTLKLYNMRVTDFPTNKEVYLPDERPNDVEVGLQAFSADMLEVARKYIKDNVDKNGNVKVGNLTKTQEAGLKDLENLVKENHIVTKTDKSGRQCLLTENEYIQVGQQHVSRDPVKSRKEMEKNEDILNCHAIQFCRLLGVCDGNNCARRLKSALMNQNTYPPSLYFTIKDHKQMVAGEPLPARPVCGATRAHNAQLGFMLVKVLDGVSDILAKQHDYESCDTQDTLAAMESKVNNQNTRDLVIFSTDVKSLYPSLDAKQCVAIITKLVKESRLVIEGINWDQAALYLAVTLTSDKVQEFGLQEVVPTWKKAGGRGRPPGITTKEVRGPLQEEKDWERSLFFPPIRRATEDEKKLILSLCVEQGLLAAFE